MPDSTRPTRSMYFQVIKSVLSMDWSLRRILDHPGSKNFNTIFAYITSLAFDKLLTTPSAGKTGTQIFSEHGEELISAKQFLEEMKWGGTEVSPYAIHTVEQLFNSFCQDKAMKKKIESGVSKYQIIETLDYPSDDQISEIRDSNKFFMMGVDDLVGYLPKSLDAGQPLASRTKTSFLPLWEAMISDPLVDVFRSEMLFNAVQNFASFQNNDDINIVELACGTGTGTLELIKSLASTFSDKNITISCYDQVPSELKRAKERVEHFDKEIRKEYTAKGLTFTYNFIVKPYRSKISVPDKSVDLMLVFQHLQYVSDKELYSYFDVLAWKLKPDGLIVVAQTTSYSDDFPHPLTPVYMAVDIFQNYPTAKVMKKVTTSSFGSVKSSGLDGIWILKKPKQV